LGIAIEHRLGWRVTFGAITGIAVLALIALIQLFPDLPSTARSRLRDEVKGLFELPLLLSLGLSMVTSTSLFCLLTYVEAYLQNVTAVPASAIMSFLLVFGLGSTLGSTLGGHFGDRALLRTILIAIVGAGATQLLFNAAGQSMYVAVLVIFVWGVFSFALVPMLQTLVADHSPRAPTLASTLNHSAFNLGNALGAIIGATILSQTDNYRALPWAGLGVAALALGITLAFYRRLSVVPPVEALAS
ncbi:MAG: MFS transporter, partial [Oxalobacteraceae bacterium]